MMAVGLYFPVLLLGYNNDLPESQKIFLHPQHSCIRFKDTRPLCSAADVLPQRGVGIKEQLVCPARKSCWGHQE